MKRISQTIVSLALVALSSSPAWAATGLAELNGLTQLLAPKSAVAPSDLDRLLEVADAVALRDATIGLSPGAIGYAAAIEKSLPQTTGERRARAERVLLDLSLAIAPLDGPEREALAAPFYAEVLASLGMKPAEARPRPALSRELGEIGRWAEATATRLIATRPKAEADPIHARLDFLSGRYSALAACARNHVKRAAHADPHWQAWLAAALISQGRSPEPYLSAALAAGGESAHIVLAALVRHASELAAAAAPRLLRAAGFTVLAPSSGGKPSAITDACRALIDRPAAPAVAQAVVPCAVLLRDPPPAWYAKATTLAPAGKEGAPLRAIARLYEIVGGKSAPETRREYRAEVGQLALTEIARDELELAPYLSGVAHSSQPSAPPPEERALLDALGKAPCDARTQPFTLLATPADEQAAQLDALTQRCAREPGGATATAAAFALLLRLSHEVPPAKGAPKNSLEPRIRAFALAHPDDPAAIAAHADVVALDALGGAHPNPIGLQAALARYDEAIAKATPASGPVELARLESNAATVALTLAELYAKSNPAARLQFTARAAHHLRYALVFGLSPAVVALRARYETFTGSGAIDPAIVSWAEKLPPEKERARVTCLLAAEADARGKRDLASRLRAAEGSASGPALDLPELVLESQVSFGARAGFGTLYPTIESRSLLYLVPPCQAK